MPTADTPTPPLFTALYAALVAVEDGRCAEVELEHRTISGEDENILTVTVRATIKPLLPTTDD